VTGMMTVRRTDMMTDIKRRNDDKEKEDRHCKKIKEKAW
jgi:hypothetical protein